MATWSGNDWFFPLFFKLFTSIFSAITFPIVVRSWFAVDNCSHDVINFEPGANCRPWYVSDIYSSTKIVITNNDLLHILFLNVMHFSKTNKLGKHLFTMHHRNLPLPVMNRHLLITSVHRLHSRSYWHLVNHKPHNYSNISFRCLLSVMMYHTVIIIIKWFVDDGYSPALAHWIYTMLALLEKPLLPDVCAALRSLAKQCRLLRSTMTESSSGHSQQQRPSIHELTLFIAIASIYFEQKDLSDHYSYWLVLPELGW